MERNWQGEFISNPVQGVQLSEECIALFCATENFALRGVAKGARYLFIATVISAPDD